MSMGKKFTTAFVSATLCLAILMPAGHGQNMTYDQGRYQDQMMRLASILGTLHHLRGMCASGEHQLWRDNMMELVRLEDPPDERKNKMVAAFNEAYEEARFNHSVCDYDARQAAHTLAGEGAQISEALASSFSPQDE